MPLSLILSLNLQFTLQVKFMSFSTLSPPSGSERTAPGGTRAKPCIPQPEEHFSKARQTRKASLKKGLVAQVGYLYACRCSSMTAGPRARENRPQAMGGGPSIFPPFSSSPSTLSSRLAYIDRHHRRFSGRMQAKQRPRPSFPPA